MSVLIGVMLAVLAVSVAIYPFLMERFRLPRPPSLGFSTGVGQQGLETILEEIKILKLEYQLGAINDAEYNNRLATYRLQAAAALRNSEQSKESHDLSLEEEIMEARRLLGGLGVVGSTDGSPELDIEEVPKQ